MVEILEKQSFLLMEYESLRGEISVAKRNMFQLTVGGAAIIPAAQSLSLTFSIDAITLALPLIVVVLVLLFLAENHTMMRAGTYILENIEPVIQEKGGWETWLASSDKLSTTRSVDKMVVFSFSILTSCYFVASFVLAWKHAEKLFGQQGQYLLGGAYASIGLVLASLLYSKAQTSTISTKNRSTSLPGETSTSSDA